MKNTADSSVTFSLKAGLPPGRPVFIGTQKVSKIQIDVMDYNEEHLEEIMDCDLSETRRLSQENSVTWINVTGVHNTELIGEIGKELGLHPLTWEDIVDTSQRPKAEEFQGYIFLVLKMMKFSTEKNDVDVEHVSLVLSNNYVVSFQEREGDVFDPIRNRIRSAGGRIRKEGTGYLLYSLMDSIVDNYFVALEKISEHIEVIDDRIVANPKPGHIAEIHRLKRSILSLRRAVWPLREAISYLEKEESDLIGFGTRTYFRNLYDHTVQVIEMVETQRDLLAGMHDTYLTSASNRMNDIMKVLTIIATVFIPLTFITGIYGMNFRHMPELDSRWAYPASLLLMALIAAAMLWYFRRKKWL